MPGEEQELTVNQAIIKYMVPATCGAAMVLGSFIGMRVLGTLDEFTKAISSLQVDVAVIKNELRYARVERGPGQ